MEHLSNVELLNLLLETATALNTVPTYSNEYVMHAAQLTLISMEINARILK